MQDEGEPISRGQLHRRSADRRAVANALWFVAFFTGVVLVNGILAILLIALLQALGLWGVGATESTSVAVDGADELRSALLAIVRRPKTLSIET